MKRGKMVSMSSKVWEDKLPQDQMADNKCLASTTVSTSKMRVGFWEYVDKRRHTEASKEDEFKVKMNFDSLENNVEGRIILSFRKGQRKIQIRVGVSNTCQIEWDYFTQVKCYSNYLNPLILNLKFNNEEDYDKLSELFQKNEDLATSKGTSQKTHQRLLGDSERKFGLTLKFDTISEREYFVLCMKEREMEITAKEEWMTGRVKSTFQIRGEGKHLLKVIGADKELKEWKMEKAILGESEGLLEGEVTSLLNKYILPESRMFRQTEIQRIAREYQQSIHMLSFKVNLAKQLRKEKVFIREAISKINSKRVKFSHFKPKNKFSQSSIERVKELLKRKHMLVEKVDILNEKKQNFENLIYKFKSLEELEMEKPRNASMLNIMNKSEMELFLGEPDEKSGEVPKKQQKVKSVRVKELEEEIRLIKEQNSVRLRKQEMVLNKINIVGLQLDAAIQTSFFKDKDIDVLLRSFRIFGVDLNNIDIKLKTRNKLLTEKLKSENSP
jgi:hypothetical protein